VARKDAVFVLKIKHHNRTRLSPELKVQYDATYRPSLEELLFVSGIVSIKLSPGRND